MVCPTGALHEKDNIPELEDAIHNKDKTVVIQLAPSISVSLAEEFGMKPGKDIGGLVIAALRKIGIDRIFDTSYAADLAALEMTHELIAKRNNKEKLPLISACCPAWVKFAEQSFPDLLPLMSTSKSPQQMLGAILKTYYPEISDIEAGNIYSVAVAPCTAKKFEAQREEMTKKGISDIDAVLTTREIAKLIRLYGIDLNQIEPELADEPFGMRSSAGKLFGAAGGMTEALVRSLPHVSGAKGSSQIKYQELRGNKGRKEVEIKAGKSGYRFVTVSGLSNALPLLEEILAGTCEYDFIEVMACAGGCINGGGQPVGADEKTVLARMKALYGIDEKETIRYAHKNPRVEELYNQFSW
jgi:iron-only hydrogenase group A